MDLDLNLHAPHCGGSTAHADQGIQRQFRNLWRHDLPAYEAALEKEQQKVEAIFENPLDPPLGEELDPEVRTIRPFKNFTPTEILGNLGVIIIAGEWKAEYGRYPHYVFINGSAETEREIVNRKIRDFIQGGSYQHLALLVDKPDETEMDEAYFYFCKAIGELYGFKPHVWVPTKYTEQEIEETVGRLKEFFL